MPQRSNTTNTINTNIYKLGYQELKSQCNIAIPTIIGLVLYKIPWMISLHFVGELGPEALAAAALATTLCNVTGMSFSVGLSSAITTLTGQARGHLLKRGHELSSIQSSPNNIIHYDKNINDEEKVILTVNNIKNNQRIIDEKKSEISPLLLLSKFEGSNWATFTNGTTENNLNDVDEDNAPLLPLVFLCRGIMIQLSIVIPIGIWWMKGIEPLLLFLGQAEKLSQMTAIYLKILTPGLWSYSINWTTTAWLQSIEMADVPAYAAFVGFLLHVPFNVLYVRVLGYGYEGVAMATVSFQLLQPLIMFFYLFGTKRGRDRILTNSGAKAIGQTRLKFWPELYASVSSFAGIKQYLELGLPGMVAISEWWASECCIFLAGTLHPNPDYVLGAMSIYQSINTFCFMFPLGFSTAGSSRVGMFLGKNQPNHAQAASKYSLLFAGLLSLTMGFILFLTPHTLFPSFFTSDPNVILQASYTIPLLAFYVFADGLQIGLQGTIKGCGKQFIMAPIVIFSYWVIGVPLSYFYTFTKNNGVMECDASSLCGIRGLIFGLLTGTWLHMLLLLFVVTFTIDWRQEALFAEERISLKEFEQGE